MYILVRKGRFVASRHRWLPAAVAGLAAVAMISVIGGLGATARATSVSGPVPLAGRPLPEPAQPSPSPSSFVPSLAPGDPLNAYLPKLPHFPPAPPPRPMALAAAPAAPWLSRIPTDQPVAFITIDDGWTKYPGGPTLVRAAGVPLTLFLSVEAIRSNPGYFAEMQAAGANIQAHTINHIDLRHRPYSTQRDEICGSADQLGDRYGRRPVLFRPPYGEKDQTTLTVAHDCGIKAVFFWTETVDKGIVRYQVGNQVKPGDILLLHFKPSFADDLLAALVAIHDAGLIPASLPDYIP
jgi:peptidoglycan/xylan/chitin deacetylase (PgdA/CDA1 family)